MPDFVSSSSGADDSDEPKRENKISFDYLSKFSDLSAKVNKTLDEINFEEATTADLGRDQPLESGAVAFEGQELQKLENENQREKQAHKLRALLFWIATALATITMLCSAFLAVWVVVVMGNADTAVIVAFISGLTIESLGILYIIANYLFPNGKK